MKVQLCRIIVSMAVMLAGAQPAISEDAFPTRPIRLIVNTAPGGLTDVTTRLIAQNMSEHLKQTIVVDNRAGGDGLIGIRAVKSARADGYTLLASAGTIAQQMAMRQDAGYDLLKDFTGIGIMGRSPYLMVVGAAQSDRTLADFIGRAKASPGKLSYASAGTGTVPHFAAERFLRQVGIKVIHIPYKGNGPAAPDVMSGRVDMIFEGYGSSSGRIKAGQVRVLGVTSSARLPALPDVPTLAEQGVSNFTAYTWLCIVAPAGTPKPIVQRLSDALRTVKSSPAIKQRFQEDATEALDMSPDEFNQFLAREVTQNRKLVADLNLAKQ
jgi:tripartite-type tricarboxylate transporter receptor subunit TctC